MIAKKICVCLIILVSAAVFIYSGKVFLERRSASRGYFQREDSALYVSDNEISALMARRSYKAESEDISRRPLNYPNLRLEATATAGIPRAYIRELDSGEAAFYRIGEEVCLARVVDIKRDEVLLNLNGSRYSLYLESGDFTEPIQYDRSSLKLVRRKDILGIVNSSEEGLSSIATLTPHKDNYGNFDGYLIDGIKTASPATLAGLRNGDILREVNNQKLLTPQKSIQVFKRVRKLKDITIGISRGSNYISKDYKIE